MSLAEIERAAIEAALVSTGGNLSKAARILGINRKTLRIKLTKYQCEDIAKRSSSGTDGT